MDLEIFGNFGLLFTTQCLSERYKITNQFSYLLIKDKPSVSVYVERSQILRQSKLWHYGIGTFTEKEKKMMIFINLYLYIKLPADSE